MWAVGIILYKMLFGIFPFKGNTDIEILKRLKNKKLEFPNTIKISLATKWFIWKILV